MPAPGAPLHLAHSPGHRTGPGWAQHPRRSEGLVEGEAWLALAEASRSTQPMWTRPEVGGGALSERHKGVWVVAGSCSVPAGVSDGLRKPSLDTQPKGGLLLQGFSAGGCRGERSAGSPRGVGVTTTYGRMPSPPRSTKGERARFLDLQKRPGVMPGSLIWLPLPIKGLGEIGSLPLGRGVPAPGLVLFRANARTPHAGCIGPMSGGPVS